MIDDIRESADMLWKRRTDVLTREELPDAVVLRIHARKIREHSPEAAAIRKALYREAETATLPVILDFSEVECFSSVLLGWLVVVNNTLRKRGMAFKHRRGRRELFAFLPDQTAALEAIRRGDYDSLMLCGLREDLREIFAVCASGGEN